MKLFTLITALLFSVAANAIEVGDMKAQLTENGLEMALTSEDGQYIGQATIYPESWAGEEMTQYTVRFAAGVEAIEVETLEETVVLEIGDWVFTSVTQSFSVTSTPVGGQFVTGLRGTLESWDLGGDRQAYVVVFRNADGEFVTWVNVDGKITRGWNTANVNGNVDDRFEIRWAAGTGELAGQLINWVSLDAALAADRGAVFHMVNGKACPVLAVRDTADAGNNGQFLTSIQGRRVHIPSAGRYDCYYYVEVDGNQKLVTSGPMAVLNDL